MPPVFLCEASALPAEGELRALSAAGRTICLAHAGGALFAVDDACPHRGGPLSEGTLEGGCVVCPWHAWSFDLATGQCVEPPGPPVRTYPVTREGDRILIELAPEA